MTLLKNHVALVTGASRGIGRGMALGLAESGATIFLTGRTLHEGNGTLPGSLESTAETVARLGDVAHIAQCDHRDDLQVEAVFERVAREVGRLDLLVNAAWGGYTQMESFAMPFWEQPRWRWDDMFQAGARAAYVASALAAPHMVRSRSGLIVNVSSTAARKYGGSVAYGASKAATDAMTRDMATELRAHGVSVVSLRPGLVRTENVMQAAEYFDLSKSESPELQGHVVAALLGDPELLARSGRALVTAELASEFGVRDLDGAQPARIEDG